MSEKAFTSNAILLVILNLLIKSVYLFGIDRTVQNVLPEGEYGLYFTLFNFAFLFQIIADFGLQNYNARNVAQARHLLQKYFPHLIGLKLLLGGAFLFVTLIAGWAWGFREPVLWWLLLGITGNQFLQSLLLFLRSNLTGLGLYRLDSWVSVLDKTLMIFIVGYLLWGPGLAGSFRIHWFVLAQTAAYVMSIGLVLAYLLPRLSGLQIRWRRANLLSALRAGAPYALVVFLMTAYTRLDAIMLEKMLPQGALEADRYASAFRLLDAANLVGFLLAGLLLPMFSRQLSLRESIVPLTRLGISTLWTGAITLALTVFCWATPIMTTLYTDGNAYSGQILQWLLLTFIPMSGGYVYGTLLTANANLRRMNYVFVLGTLANIGLNLWLIPRAGALGAAQATFVTQSFTFLAQLWLAQHLLQLPVAWGLVGRFLTLALVVLGVGWVLQSWEVAWWFCFLLQLSLGGGAALLLGLLDWRAWLSSLR